MGGPGSEAAAALARRVLALLGGRTPVLVCVDGRSGSGKSTLARRTTRHLRDAGAAVTVLHLDHLYPGWDGLAEASRLVGEHLLPALRRGEEPLYPAWSWVRGRPGPDVRVRQADVVLVEGVGSASRSARRHTDLVVWVEAPEDVRRARALERDGDTYAPHWRRWADQEDAYLTAEDPAGAAHVRVVTAGPGAPGAPGTTEVMASDPSWQGPSLEP